MDIDTYIREHTKTQREEDHVKMKAKFEVMQPQAKNARGYQKLEETRKDPFLEASEGAWPCHTLISNC